jgi:hypothetical protein
MARQKKYPGHAVGRQKSLRPDQINFCPVGCIYSFVFRNGKLATRVGRVASLVDWRPG